MADYERALFDGLIDQFRDKANIAALVRVIARQLQDVFSFYEQLRLARDVYSAQGRQLDGIGNIVGLTRTEAGLLTGDPIPCDVLDDDTYRRYIIFKILKNTSHATYPDIIKGIQMFWDRPMYYSEDPGEPATMVLDTGEMQGLVDTTPLFMTPLIRAAGVTIRLYAQTSTAMEPAPVCLASGLGFSTTQTELPTLERNISYRAEVGAGSVVQSLMETSISGVTP